MKKKNWFIENIEDLLDIHFLIYLTFLSAFGLASGSILVTYYSIKLFIPNAENYLELIFLFVYVTLFTLTYTSMREELKHYKKNFLISSIIILAAFITGYLLR